MRSGGANVGVHDFAFWLSSDGRGARCCEDLRQWCSLPVLLYTAAPALLGSLPPFSACPRVLTESCSAKARDEGCTSLLTSSQLGLKLYFQPRAQHSRTPACWSRFARLTWMQHLKECRVPCLSCTHVPLTCDSQFVGSQ